MVERKKCRGKPAAVIEFYDVPERKGCFVAFKGSDTQSQTQFKAYSVYLAGSILAVSPDPSAMVRAMTEVLKTQVNGSLVGKFDPNLVELLENLGCEL